MALFDLALECDDFVESQAYESDFDTYLEASLID